MLNKFRKYFLSGLVVLLPTVLTIYLFILVINFADGILGKYLEPYFYDKFGFYFQGLSILVGLYIIVVIGFFVTNFLGRRIHEYFERLILKLPFFRQVYPALKEITLFLFSRDRFSSFRQVVLVEYPRKGIYSFGFLTNDSSQRLREKTKRELVNVFIPSAPGPLTGFVIMVSKKEIIPTDFSVEQAVKFIVSGGVVNPS